MDGLKRSITGKYNANDVDRLLLKVRNDYEKCLKEQKERIISLREENREIQSILEKHKSNEEYIIEVIARAEETADLIIKEADLKAKEKIEAAEKEERRLRYDIEVNCQRLYKLKRASEAIFRAVSKVLGEHIDDENIRIQNNIRPLTTFIRSRIND
jgi:cell division septum initiation protein DivIVA